MEFRYSSYPANKALTFTVCFLPLPLKINKITVHHIFSVQARQAKYMAEARCSCFRVLGGKRYIALDSFLFLQ